MLTLLFQQNLEAGAEDTICDPFTFNDQTNVALSTLRQSNVVTISGLGNGVSVAVTVTGGELRKNNGAWSISPTTAVNGDTFEVRHAASGLYSSPVHTTLNVGGVTDTFTSTTTVDPASVVVPFARPSRLRFVATQDDGDASDVASATSFRFSRSCLKDPGEQLSVELDFYHLAIARWAPNDLCAAGETIRPDVGTGFAYVVDVAGTTAADPPRWPRTANATVQDGSVTWRAVSAGNLGLHAITDTPTATSEPEGLTVSEISVEEDFKVLATFGGGVLGRTYDVAFTLVLRGKTRVARLRVEVRKR